MTAAVAVLQKNPQADFQTVKAKVAKHGDLFPIVYGRAKALLGLVKSKPRKDRVATTGSPKRGPGRPPKGPLAAVANAHARKARANGIQPTITGIDPAQGLAHSVNAVIGQRNALHEGLLSVRKQIDELLQTEADKL